MTPNYIRSLPVVQPMAFLGRPLDESVGFVDDAVIQALIGGESMAVPQTNQVVPVREAGEMDYAGWSSPFHWNRQMAFAR